MELKKRGKYWHYDHTSGHTRLRGTTKKTDKYVARLYAQGIIDKFENKGVKIKNDDFGAFVKKFWINKGPYFRPKTITSMKIALNHFIEFAKPKSVSEVNVEICQEFMSSYLIKEKGMKPVSANTNLNKLRQIFKAAEDWDYIVRNPFTKVPYISFQPEERRPLSPASIDKFLDYTSVRCPRYYNLFYFYFLTGMRMNEPFAMRWENVDLAGLRIYVNWTKTKYNRTIVLLPEAVDILLEAKASGAKKPFPFYYKNVTNMIETIRVEPGLNMPEISIKVFRQCATSYLRARGVPNMIVDKIMGHSTEVAFNDYFSLPNQELVDQIRPLQDLLPKRKKVTAQLRHKDASGRFARPI